ncbi:MAG: hypothetical protein K9N11_06390 [Lentisphaeria bacterium]|nr:hypothetical protein [Candidatus Neomarinimicrobiota bacterium]MCF7842463.1 hypothetical protein [Lentisphaeria bacterium]
MRWLILSVYLVQFIEIIWFPIPSDVSTLRLVRSGERRPWVLLTVGLLGIFTFHLPLLFITYPEILKQMTPLLPPGLQPIPAFMTMSFLLLGSAFTILGVRALRMRQKNAPDALTTAGIYRICRHPINLGLMLIMVGFILVYPYWIMVPGAVAFFYNLHTRSCWEEKRLLLVHGEGYQAYQRRVAMYGLRVKPK